MTYDMTINYRCSPAILGLANRILSEYKPLIANNRYGYNVLPQYLVADNEQDEANILVKEVQKLHKKGRASSTAFRRSWLCVMHLALCSTSFSVVLRRFGFLFCIWGSREGSSARPYLHIPLFAFFHCKSDRVSTFHSLVRCSSYHAF